jgi:diaminopimelate decarboxylase
VRLYGTMEIGDNGHLYIGGCDTVELAKKWGTPLYVMDEAEIRQRCRAYKQVLEDNYPDSHVIYAGKTFMTMAMCRLMEEEGLGLDLVSGGELYTACCADFPAEEIYLHGNNKSIGELELALEKGVGRIVVDNFYELELLEELAKNHKRKAKILLRVTPGVEAHTHSYIQTGQVDSKFGLGINDGLAQKAVERALQLEHLDLVGLHCHIGSQIVGLESFDVTIEVMIRFIAELKEKLHWECKELSLGGGLGIRYTQKDPDVSIEEFGKRITAKLKSETAKRALDLPKLIVEPGRSIAGEAGTTLYTIGSIKQIPGVRKYVAVDGGMGDNPRVALYQAEYQALLANRATDAPSDLVSIAGKCCESGDMLIWDLMLPEAKSGDILAVFCTGAYNYSMASNYNRLPRPAVVLVSDGKADLIVQRESYEDLVRLDEIPERLAKGKMRIAL